jgi:toxin ParE1/3/4
MAEISRFRQAEEDLLAIAGHIALDNPTAAANWLDKIEKSLALLATQPLMGQAVDHIRTGLRRISQGNYLIFYEPRDEGIVLVRVLHAARQIEDLFR